MGRVILQAQVRHAAEGRPAGVTFRFASPIIRIGTGNWHGFGARLNSYDGAPKRTSTVAIDSRWARCRRHLLMARLEA